MDGTMQPIGSKKNRAVKWIGSLLAVAMAIAGFLYLRHLKEIDESPIRMPTSLETIRRSVERGVDQDVASVSRSPIESSLGQLRAFPRPVALVKDRFALADRRATPLETHVWRLRARVIEAMLRTDNDLYLVIEADGTRSCVEVPDPRLCKGSPFLGQITKVRDQLEKELNPTFRRSRVDREAELVGVGYFGTAGKNDNGARLMPLLQLRWIRK